MLDTDARMTGEGGQTMILAIVLLSLASTLMLGLVQVSLAAQEKIRLQISADMAVLSALNSQANALNSIALANRAILANDALAGQLNALVSETTFYRKLADKFRRLLRFVPYAGPVSRFVSAGVNAIEKSVKRATSLCLPLINLSNKTLGIEQKAIRLFIPASSLRSARLTLKENMETAKISHTSKLLILRQARSLQRCIVPLDPENVRKLKVRTMDRHTLKRNWRIKVAGISPLKKSGGTTVVPANLISRDLLRMKVLSRLRWRWKTKLSAESKASDFGYRTADSLFSLNMGNARSGFSLPIMITSKMPPYILHGPFKEKELFALAAAKIVYRRKSRDHEKPNLLNPFWSCELIPVASEPNAKRLIPGMILKEIKH